MAERAPRNYSPGHPRHALPRNHAKEMEAKEASPRQSASPAHNDVLRAATTQSMPQFRIVTSTARPGDLALGEKGGQKLRVFFVTEEDPLYVIRFFEIFFAEYPHEEIDISGITIDRPFHEPIWETMRRVRVLYGFWGLFRQGLRFTGARLRGRSIESLAVSARVLEHWRISSIRIVFRSTRSSQLSHASRAITSLRLSVWNQSSTSIESAAPTEPIRSVVMLATGPSLQQPVSAFAKFPHVFGFRKRKVARLFHVERR